MTKMTYVQAIDSAINGNINEEVLEKLDFPAAVFSAPAFSDMMERKPVFLTTKAVSIGAAMDMTGEELLVLFS